MDRDHVTFALRRPRTCMHHKPRLGSHLFLELDETNGFMHTHETNGSKANRNGEAKETSNESSESLDTFRKPIKQKQCHAVYTKDLNRLGGDDHTDKARCKPGMSNRTPKSERFATSKFLDDGINEGICRDSGTARGHNSARNVWKKYDTDCASRAKLGPDRNAVSCSKPATKCVENKAIKVIRKKNPTFNVDGITQWPEEGSQLVPKTVKKKGFHEIASPEAKRRRSYGYAQGTLDNEDIHSSGQSTPESEQNMHGNHGIGTPRTSHVNGTEGLQVPSVRKSSRVPKKRIFDDDEEEPVRKQRKWLQVEHSGGYDLNAKHDEAMDLAGDANECFEKEYHKGNEISGPCVDEKKELPLTARQRALRLSKEGGEPQNGSNVDFPDGLQPVVPRKQKESLNEAEQAIKKEEAARRRKQQMERNAKEIQASAIQKILGQESSRKKREEKLQKQREEIEQEKQAASMAPAVNSIRWVMGPSGNLVSFSQDVELPKIFSGPCSYPREREKCAGPSCSNVYKYRDAKTRLPLCSLQCYKAVQELPRAVF